MVHVIRAIFYSHPAYVLIDATNADTHAHRNAFARHVRDQQPDDLDLPG